MTKPVFKLKNINGKFDHVRGKAEAIALACEIEGLGGLSERQLIQHYGWTFTRLSKEEAKAVGL